MINRVIVPVCAPPVAEASIDIENEKNTAAGHIQTINTAFKHAIPDSFYPAPAHPVIHCLFCFLVERGPCGKHLQAPAPDGSHANGGGANV